MTLTIERFFLICCRSPFKTASAVLQTMGLLNEQLEQKVQERTSELLKANQEMESLSQYLGKIRASANRMTALIQAVLNYSRILKTENLVEQVDLNETLTGVLSDFEIVISEKNATIKADKLPLIKSNGLQMHQLFSNIISNSLKFSVETLEISISCTHLSSEESNARVGEEKEFIVLKFADNGIGFNPAFTEKIFIPFQRLHAVEEFHGTGIGLSIVKKIVDQNGAAISVESKEGEGTMFSIFLPNHRE